MGGQAFQGGAFNCISSSLVIASSTFEDNRAYGTSIDGAGNGGAIHASHSHVYIRGSYMLGNKAERCVRAPAPAPCSPRRVPS